MRLNFSILWFDDDDAYFDSLDVEPLEDEISSWGFIPKIMLVKTPSEFESHSPFETIDLIVVDRDLGEYDEGQKFIADLRNNAIYTEVIFYTAGNASDLWDAIRKEQLEGVFVSNRNPILSKISKVGRQSIRKVLDLENMRGIVMAEVGELDHLLDEIITVGIDTLSSNQQQSIFKKFHKGASEQNNNLSERLAAFNQNPNVAEMLDLSDSYKRWLCFYRLWKAHEKLKNKKIGDFNTEVLMPRNFLAHGRPERHQDGNYTFIYQGKNFDFNDQVSLALRQTILEYKIRFAEMLEILTPE